MDSLLNIVYQDEDLVIVNKPSGLLAVPGRSQELQDCIVSRVRKNWPNCPVYPAVHRLDMDTSGLLLLGLTVESHRLLSKQFEDKVVEKEYEALLEGEPLLEKSGEIALKFRLDIDHRPYQIYDPILGKLGVTKWYLLENRSDGLIRIRLVPLTGRTHQLRLHMSHKLGLNRPIVGDRLYGNGTGPGQLKLHASTLKFNHPRTGERMTFNVPPLF